MAASPAVGVWGVGSAVPERILTNADLEGLVDTSDEWIRTRTGIRERRIAAADEAASDLGLQAARRALAAAGVEPGEIDLIVVATATPDMPFPATACLIQHRLGCGRAAAYDLSAACSGFVYALDQAVWAVAGGCYRRALVIGADVLSRITNWQDRSTCVLFGDGAGAVVLGPVAPGYGVLATYLGADGSGGDKLCVPGGGSRLPLTPEVLAAGSQYIHMSGNDVFKFAVRILGEATLEVLRRAGGLTPADVDLFVPHQANVRIIEAAARRLELPPERVYVNVDRYGNTSSASIPLALDEAGRQGRLREGDRVVLVGLGGGLTWGAVALRWGRGKEP